MGLRELVVVFLAGSLALLSERSAAADAELTLAIGASVELLAPHAADLRVTRRGVVDLRALAGGRWEVTALRAGFVLIDAVTDVEPGTVARWRVRVLAADAGRSAARGREKEGAFLPAWLCRANGVACDEDARALRGETSEHGIFLAGLQVCVEADACYFDLALDENGREGWRSALQALYPDLAFVVSARGYLRIEGPCTGSAPPPLATALAPKARSIFRCSPALPAQAYELAVKLVLAEDGVAEALGFRSGAELALAAGRPASASSSVVAAKLEAARQEHRLEVIGEPLLRLPAGVETEVDVGGETHYATGRTTTDTPENRAWKRHGLALKVTPTPRTGTRVHLAFDASLRLKEGGADGMPALSLSAVKSAIELEPERPRVAAALDLSSAAVRDFETIGLARLPILGPLFRLGTRNRSRTRVWLTFTLRPDAQDGPIQPFKGPE